MHLVDNWEDDGFYLTKDLTKKEIDILDRILNSNGNTLKKFNKRIQETAELRGKQCTDIVLRDEQVRPMLMSFITKRFFIGDEPGLGKTVMSAASYANYLYFMKKKGLEGTKVLVVTTSSHVYGFAREWKSYGIDLLPLTEGSNKIGKKLRNNNEEEYDGLITNWDGLKTNSFLDFYMRNHDKYNFAILDETSVLKKDTSVLSIVTNILVNKYKKGIDRVIFLNGSSMEKEIFDFYYQFKVLKNKLIPNKQFLEDNYVIRGGAPAHVMYGTGIEGRRKGLVTKNLGAIKDYKNQHELRERLKYFFLARSKKDYSNDIPTHNYKLHEIEMTPKQKKLMKNESNATMLNSPKTRDSSLELTVKNSPKLEELISFVQKVEKDRPLIYVYNIESQNAIVKELEKIGYRVGLIRGGISFKERDNIVDRFNNKKLDIIVFNIKRALNVPTSDRILFYDIPTMPHETKQVIGRIDRDNYEDTKFHDFFCYLNSPEMENIIKLSLFREEHGSKFTGQESYIYKSIIDQLSLYYGKDNMENLKDKSEEYDTITDFYDSDDWEEFMEDMV